MTTEYDLRRDEDALNPFSQEEPMGRQLNELEVQVSEIVQRLEAGVTMNGVANERRGSKTPSSVIEPEKSTIDDVLKLFEDIIVSTDPDRDSEEPLAKPVNDLVKNVVLSHSIVAYLGNLSRSHISGINNFIHSETSRWLSHLFRFPDYEAYYHHDHLEGLVRITRMMIHYKYPRYLEDGALAIAERLPSIYSSVASPLGIVQHLCRQLGLPLACIRPVPVDSSTQTMDIAALQTLIEEDLDNSNHLPIIVLADAGTATCGHSENIFKISELCKAHNIWLHVRGHTLAALCIPTHIAIESHRLADSVTLTLSTWLGIQGLPVVTLYRVPQPDSPGNNISPNAQTVNSSRESTLPVVSGLASHFGANRIASLPLWMYFKLAGFDEMINKLKNSFEMCRRLYETVTLPQIKLLSQKPGDIVLQTSEHVISTIPVYSNFVWASYVPCVVFKYEPAQENQHLVTPDYCNRLNSWMGQIIQREVPQLNIELCETEAAGVVLRYCPLEAQSYELQEDGPNLLNDLCSCMQQQLEILQATVQLKHTYGDLVEKQPLLRKVNIQEWAGVGGVRYVPAIWSSIRPSAEDMDRLTTHLVQALRTTDQAFSAGRADDGLLCIRFGMVTADTDIEELLNLIVNVGKEVEQQTKVLESMTEMVKKGIEEAQAELERENAERWSEGILRRVPVVGRLAEWWKPETNSPMPGRSLYLPTGDLLSTEPLYKHFKMPSEQGPDNDIESQQSTQQESTERQT